MCVDQSIQWCMFSGTFWNKEPCRIKKNSLGSSKMFRVCFQEDSRFGPWYLHGKKTSSSVMNAPIKQSPRIKTRPHIIEINYSIFSPIGKASIYSNPSFIKCLSSCLAGRFCFPFGDWCPCFRSQPSSYIILYYIILYYIILYHITLYHITLYYIILYHIILYYDIYIYYYIIYIYTSNLSQHPSASNKGPKTSPGQWSTTGCLECPAW